ncbi:MAG: hypothetical protein R2854_13620 [Caldilineaceae bacterium]
MDVDERGHARHGREIRQRIATDDAVGYWIPRRNFIVGHEMRGGGYYPDAQLRLLRRDAARYVAEREVHEIVALTARRQLDHPFIHINYTNWPQFHAKQRFYAAYEARILRSRGIRPRPHNFVLQPLREFRCRFFTPACGCQDGLQRLRLAALPRLVLWIYALLDHAQRTRLKNEE